MTADEWNAKCPVGTPVRYWSGFRSGPGTRSCTRSEAWDVSGHAVVKVVGVAGGIALTHVEPVVGDERRQAAGDSDQEAELRFTLTPEARVMEGI